MISNIILPNLDTCDYSYIRYFLLNKYFIAITALYEFTLLIYVDYSHWSAKL